MELRTSEQPKSPLNKEFLDSCYDKHDFAFIATYCQERGHDRKQVLVELQARQISREMAAIPAGDRTDADRAQTILEVVESDLVRAGQDENARSVAVDKARWMAGDIGDAVCKADVLRHIADLVAPMLSQEKM